jgi:hypothetical protein
METTDTSVEEVRFDDTPQKYFTPSALVTSVYDLQPEHFIEFIDWLLEHDYEDSTLTPYLCCYFNGISSQPACGLHLLIHLFAGGPGCTWLKWCANPFNPQGLRSQRIQLLYFLSLIAEDRKDWSAFCASVAAREYLDSENPNFCSIT